MPLLLRIVGSMRGTCEQQREWAGPEARPFFESEGITPQLELGSRTRHPAAVLARNEQAGAHASEEEEDSEGERGADAGVAPLEAGRVG